MNPKPPMILSWETVTPEVAAAWLEQNISNRPVSDRRVRSYASDMRDKRWLRTAEPITFDSDGRLQNGQHRLWAVIESGESQEFLVARDADPEAFHVLDTNMVRSPGQMLAIAGVADAVHIAASARNTLRYDIQPGSPWTGSSELITKAAVHEYVLSHEAELRAASHDAYKWSPIFRRRASVASALYVIRRDTACQDKYEDFVQAVATGAGLALGDPRLAVRQYGLSAVIRGSGTSGSAQLHMAAILKGWNAWAEGDTVKQLRFRKTELPMPKVT